MGAKKSSFDNQYDRREPPSAAAGRGGFDDSPLLSAEQAAARLGVKKSSLYAYVSRGKIRRVGGPDGRTRRYLASDVERVRRGAAARAGHAAVAATALRWGEPVLETSIAEVTERGPRYRGALAVELAEGGASFEAVAERLWDAGESGATSTKSAPQSAPRWPAVRAEWAALLPLPPLRSDTPLRRITRALHGAACLDPLRNVGGSPAELRRARELCRLAAAALAVDAERASAALAAETIAEAVALALGLGRVSATTRRRRYAATATTLAALDAALILCAEHELNASSFTARVAASAGADLHACLAAALATFSGPRHGGACERVERFARAVLLDDGERGRRAVAAQREALAQHIALGERVPGFGHPLYLRGDPRARVLLDLARRLPEPRRAASRRLSRALLGAVDAMAELEQLAPNLDVALVTLASRLGLSHGAATALFGVGRIAGWVAHALEQRAAPELLRPRARYVAQPPPRDDRVPELS